MNFARDAVNPRGAGTTFFHEHGHLIDYAKVTPLHSDPNFKKALQQDFDSYIIRAKQMHPILSKKALYQQLSRDITQANQAAGDGLSSISDLMEGLSTAGNSKYSIADGWRHGRQYWQQRPTGVESEAFAHFYEAHFDAARLGYIRQYFPTASMEFERILKGAIQ
jgi:hypothetical protein